ncbi:glycosyltransferase family 4 protein [Ruminococcus albus]|uniref:Glycosyl transferase group 1 n=1 Tax=Ruminococcus albus (strain ATCC 27210 / DSM 20455 / JCM 14654 / NCDO 2250 / 7) TaxID=697329 RepID=E6UK40_RUMA7|nr:glycosyltransferase family 4 protein [Ruminococcus albus]ADU24036.1 glycosyl transferase group 1 [Ruminococcus albus 7 = DSM 20455]
MNKKHILVITQYFYPEQFRINDMCAEWVKRGYEVTVVTGYPNYPQGEYYDGYGWFRHTKQKWKGVKIIRLPLTARKQGSVRLALNYLSFVISGLIWAKTTNVKADYVFTYEVSPMTQALVGVWYSKRRKIPNYLYVTDLWPENVEIITGIKSKWIITPIQWMVDYIYKRNNRILTSSKSFIKSISKRRIPFNKIEFWPQYAEEFYKPIIHPQYNEIPQDGIFNIVFAGNIGYAQGLGILVDSAKQLLSKGILVRFNIIGNGRYLPELKKLVKDSKTDDYFNFIDRKNPEEIPSYISSADASLICLSKSEVFSITIPAKTQSCMACGKPILVSADGEVQDIIKEAKAGLVSGSEDVDALTNNIVLLKNTSINELNEMGNNALKYYSENFEKKKLMDRMDKILEGS